MAKYGKAKYGLVKYGRPLSLDKNQALVDFLLTCEAIYKSPLYFNFVDAKDGVNQFLTLTEDKNIEQPYIDGSVKKMYSMSIISFLTISNNPIVKVSGISNENVSDIAVVQKLVDWVTLQNKNRNFPDFGANFVIDEIRTTTNNPNLKQIDATRSIPLAQYSFTIQVIYIDNTDVIWK